MGHYTGNIGNILFLSWLLSTWGIHYNSLYILCILNESYFLLLIFQMLEEYVQIVSFF